MKKKTKPKYIIRVIDVGKSIINGKAETLSVVVKYTRSKLKPPLLAHNAKEVDAIYNPKKCKRHQWIEAYNSSNLPPYLYCKKCLKTKDII